MELIKFDLNLIKKSGLTFMDYVTLYCIYSKKKMINIKFVSNFGGYSANVIAGLQGKGYIFLVGSDALSTLDIREKTYTLFEGDKDHFLEWLSRFPIKTPSGRYLGPKGSDTKAGVALRKKWEKDFKNNSQGAIRAIEVLGAEMDWRRNNGKFEFMHNAETWLNQGDYEKYEYLLDDKEKFNQKSDDDFV